MIAELHLARTQNSRANLHMLSVKIEPNIQEILLKYADSTIESPYVFPILTYESYCQFGLRSTYHATSPPLTVHKAQYSDIKLDKGLVIPVGLDLTSWL